MKRNDIKKAVDRHLACLGFSRGSWLWQPGGSLIIIVGGRIKQVKLRAGMSKRELTYHLGIMTGWHDFAAPAVEAWEPPTRRSMANGHAIPQQQFQFTAMSAG